MKSVCFLLLLFVCNAIQAGNGAAKKEIKEEEVEESGSIYRAIKEEEAAEEEAEESGSAPAQISKKEQMISVYSSMYRAIIQEEKELRVNLRKHQGLAALCHFFNSCKEKRALSRDPVQDAGYIKKNYDDIKNTLRKNHKSRLPSCDSIVAAIQQVETRKEAGDDLLKHFLGKNTKLQNQMISMYSSLYWAIIKDEKELSVPLEKNQGLASLCDFFKSCKKDKILSGKPAQDAPQIEKNYNQIKRALRKTSKSYLPSCHRIVDAIQQAETRKEAGDELLKPLLSEKKDQMISMYSSLYWAIIKDEKELHIPLEKNQGLASLCHFFNSCKGPEMLSGKPAQDAGYIKKNYDSIKDTLIKTSKSYLPSCDRIVAAIQQVETRKEAGDELFKHFLREKRVKSENLLKHFLREKRVKSENISEEEAAEEAGDELFKPLLSEKEVKVKKEEAHDITIRHFIPESDSFHE